MAVPPDERGASRETSRTFQKGKINCSYEEEPGGGLNIPGENGGSLVVAKKILKECSRLIKQVASDPTSHTSDLLNHDPITPNLGTSRESSTLAVISNGSLTNSSNMSTNEEPSTLQIFTMVPEPHTLPVITSEVVITISCTQYSLLPPSLPSPDMKNTLITARVQFSTTNRRQEKGKVRKEKCLATDSLCARTTIDQHYDMNTTVHRNLKVKKTIGLE